MKSLLTACVSLALALGAACSSEHSGIPAAPSFDPIGSEPVSADGGAGNGSVIQYFCEQGCEKIATACHNGYPVAYCTQACVNNVLVYPGCVAEQLAFYACLATINVDCSFGFPQAAACDPAQQAIGQCQSRPPPLPE